MQIHATPYPALNGLMLELVSSVKAILQDNFVGAYLQGSLAIGDFDEHSDIDFVVVTEEDPTDLQAAALEKNHARLCDLGGLYPPDFPATTGTPEATYWETSLEGSYFPKDRLKQHKLTGTKLWYVDNGSRILERSEHDDTLVVRWTMRERGITLTGPDPKSLIDPIPANLLRREILATMLRIQNDITDGFWHSGFGQPFAVMTFCRMLQSLETAEIHSKRESIEWGLKKLDSRWHDLIQKAWECRGHVYVSEPAIEEDFQRTLEFIDYAIDESARYELSFDRWRGQ